MTRKLDIHIPNSEMGIEQDFNARITLTLNRNGEAAASFADGLSIPLEAFDEIKLRLLKLANEMESDGRALAEYAKSEDADPEKIKRYAQNIGIRPSR